MAAVAASSLFICPHFLFASLIDSSRALLVSPAIAISSLLKDALQYNGHSAEKAADRPDSIASSGRPVLYPPFHGILTSLSVSRVKKIISQDPDVNICSNNAAFVVTLATVCSESPPWRGSLLPCAPRRLSNPSWSRKCSFNTLRKKLQSRRSWSASPGELSSTKTSVRLLAHPLMLA